MSSPLASATAQPPEVVLSIPADCFHSFPERPVILRSSDPAELSRLFGHRVPEGLVFVELTGLAADMAPLADWGEGVAVDLVMTDPLAELPCLYRCAGLLQRHPTRVSVPFQVGLAQAVKLALALGFAVRLYGQQPSAEAVAEARQALQDYLHNPTVAQPVEPFQGLLIALLHDTPVALWSLQEADPAALRRIDASGQALPAQGPPSVVVFRDALLAAGGECRDCPWLDCCGGYFKWPDDAYACSGVKALFTDLAAAASALRADLAAHTTNAG